MEIVLREVEVYRPYGGEAPLELLWDAGADDDCVARCEAAQVLRIAKIDERVLGLYAMDRVDERRFRIHGVVVDPVARKRGLGRWLVGHAIGVAESKGGRHVLGPKSASRCLPLIGFTADGDDLRLDLIPE